MKSSIEYQMANLERALERGDISDEEYDQEMESLIHLANSSRDGYEPQEQNRRNKYDR